MRVSRFNQSENVPWPLGSTYQQIWFASMFAERLLAAQGDHGIYRECSAGGEQAGECGYQDEQA
jgi:hypothetical protein